MRETRMIRQARSQRFAGSFGVAGGVHGKAEALRAAHSVRPPATGLAPRFPAAAWYEALRPRSIRISITSVLVGSLLAWYEGHLNLVLLTCVLMAVVASHLGIHLLYEYCQGLDRHARSTGVGATSEGGLLTADEALNGALVSFVAAGLLSLALVAAAGWPVLALGLVGVVAAALYCGFLRRGGTRGGAGRARLVNAVTFLIMGPLAVGGAYLVQAQTLSLAVSGPALAMGLLAVAARYARNTHRDDEIGSPPGGAARGRGGRPIGPTLTVCVAGAYVALAIGVTLHALPWGIGTVALTLPAAWRAVAIAWRGAAPELRRVEQVAARLHWHFGLTAAGGLVLSRLFGG